MLSWELASPMGQSPQGSWGVQGAPWVSAGLPSRSSFGGVDAKGLSGMAAGDLAVAPQLQPQVPWGYA